MRNRCSMWGRQEGIVAEALLTSQRGALVVDERSFTGGFRLRGEIASFDGCASVSDDRETAIVALGRGAFSDLPQQKGGVHKSAAALRKGDAVFPRWGRSS